MFDKKNILVTGGTGLIGRPLVEMLLDLGANVRIVSLDDPSRAHPDAEFLQMNLMLFENCLKVCKGIDIVFNLIGIKGSPAMTKQKPASFFVPTISFNTNMMLAAYQSGVERYLFTSSIGVYAPAEIFYEDDVWNTFPSDNDKFAGWAKRMGELQAEAFNIEYGWNKVSIVRPANVYGPYDNFDPKNAMVIPSLIRRALEGENPFTVWGDGSAIRDFIHARDVAEGMIHIMKTGETRPVNLGSGVGVTIKELVEIVIRGMQKKPEVIWDTTKPTGDKKRLMDMTRASSLGFYPKITIDEGIKEVISWYIDHRNVIDKRYNVFTEKKIL